MSLLNYFESFNEFKVCYYLVLVCCSNLGKSMSIHIRVTGISVELGEVNLDVDSHTSNRYFS